MTRRLVAHPPGCYRTGACYVYGGSALNTHVAIAGQLGSGKSTVAAGLSRATGMPVHSAGSVLRQISRDRGLTTLQGNLLANEDPNVDSLIDGALAAVGPDHPPTIFDARMAWWFVPDAFRIQLVVDPAVAARRIHLREAVAEAYDSVEEASRAAVARGEVERARFQEKYGADMADLRNYDLVVDTSDASVDDVVATISTAFREQHQSRPCLFISPLRAVLEAAAAAAPEGREVRVRYSRRRFVVVQGARQVLDAARLKQPLLPARLTDARHRSTR